MMSQIHGHQERLIHDVWGERCLECDCTHKPKVHLCPSCDFTIVVVEVEKLTDLSIADEIKKRTNSLVATHQSFP
jgi:hypothetical protein